MGEVVAVDEEDVMSARRPKAKQMVDMDMPMIVRNWRCQPYEEFWNLSVHLHFKLHDQSGLHFAFRTVFQLLHWEYIQIDWDYRADCI